MAKKNTSLASIITSSEFFMGISLSQWLTSKLLGFQPCFSGSELAEYVLVSACTTMFIKLVNGLEPLQLVYKDVVYVLLNR